MRLNPLTLRVSRLTGKRGTPEALGDLAAHLGAILDSLRVDEGMYVVGNSYGGAMAANFAEQRPERTRAPRSSAPRTGHLPRPMASRSRSFHHRASPTRP